MTLSNCILGKTNLGRIRVWKCFYMKPPPAALCSQKPEGKVLQQWLRAGWTKRHVCNMGNLTSPSMFCWGLTWAGWVRLFPLLSLYLSFSYQKLIMRVRRASTGSQPFIKNGTLFYRWGNWGTHRENVSFNTTARGQSRNSSLGSRLLSLNSVRGASLQQPKVLLLETRIHLKPELLDATVKRK